MSVSTVAHLNFTGDAREALAFYHSVFGDQIMIATYGQVGVPQDSPHGDQAAFGAVDPDSPDTDHVAFGMVAADNGFRLAAYDVFGANDGGIATAAGSSPSVHRAAGLPTPSRSSCCSTATPSTNSTTCGTSSPTAPPSSRHSPRPSGRRPTECSPTGSASRGSSASTLAAKSITACPRLNWLLPRTSQHHRG